MTDSDSGIGQPNPDEHGGKAKAIEAVTGGSAAADGHITWVSTPKDTDDIEGWLKTVRDIVAERSQSGADADRPQVVVVHDEIPELFAVVGDLTGTRTMSELLSDITRLARAGIAHPTTSTGDLLKQLAQNDFAEFGAEHTPATLDAASAAAAHTMPQLPEGAQEQLEAWVAEYGHLQAALRGIHGAVRYLIIRPGDVLEGDAQVLELTDPERVLYDHGRRALDRASARAAATGQPHSCTFAELVNPDLIEVPQTRPWLDTVMEDLNGTSTPNPMITSVRRLDEES